ncbi:MAG: queuosine salvage family protein [Desulfobacteraceae bacterium]
MKIDENRLAAFVNDLDIQAVKCSSHLMDIPIAFRDLHAAVNFHINLHLFNFGHGFRHPLHKICGRGAWQTMKQGIMSLQLNTKNGFIDADTLIKLSVESVNQFFQFPTSGSSSVVEEIFPLRDMILKVAHFTGRRLIELGYSSFADFIFENSSGSQPSSLRLIESLADNFPAFDDRRVINKGKEVLFLKKAQIAVAELYQKLENELSEKIPFEDIKKITVVCDNVLPCVLRGLGILKIDSKLESKIDRKKILPAGWQEAQLRASAICAVEMILQKANGAFWAKEIGDFLWTLGKVPKFRKIERHATINTCFY